MSYAAPRRLAHMPTRHPRLLHLMPYSLGDSLHALWVLVNSVIFWGIDQNGQVSADFTVWIMHWPRIRRNGLRWIFTGRHDAKGREIRRRLSALEANRLVQHCSDDFLSRLRRRKRGGGRIYKAEVHMRRLAELNAERVAKGKREKVWSLEAKGNPLFQQYDQPWHYLRGAACRTGVLMDVMTLQRSTSDNHRAFVVLTKAHQILGVPVAVLPRAPKPDNWHEWEALGVEVWGRWR